MNSERGEEFKEIINLPPLENVAYFLDGTRPLEGGRFRDCKVGIVVDYFTDLEGDFYRDKAGDVAANSLMFELTILRDEENGVKEISKVILSTWSSYCKRWFKAGILGIRVPLVRWYPSLRELSFNEGRMRVKEDSIFSRDFIGYNDRRLPLGEWVLLGSSTIIKITKNHDSPLLNFSLAGHLGVWGESAPNNVGVVIFTTRLPNELSIQQIVNPNTPASTARTLALEYTPQLRPVTPGEEEIFESLLRFS